MEHPALFPPMTADDAASIGYRRFNRCPHLTVDIPDGGFTLTTKTSDGKRTTFYFGVSIEGGPATFIDIQYHDAGTQVPNADNGTSPVFDMLTIARNDHRPFDSRKLPVDRKPSIAVVLLEPVKEPSQ